MIDARVARSRAILILALGAVLMVGVAASVAARPSSTPSLPPTSPDRLIASTLQALARDPSVSGRLTAHLDLGLPSIPIEGRGAAASKAAGFLASLTGNHRLHLWSSADGFRLADLLQASERAVFVSRTDAWAWDFSSFTAYHLGRSPHGTRRSQHVGDPRGLDLVDPLGLTRRALDAITPSTHVAVTGTTRVAGRPAYVLALEPRTNETLVKRIEIAVDSEHRVPLRVAVMARGRRAATVSVAFNAISFTAINPAVYRFRPPSGATVRDLSRAFEEEGEGQEPRGSQGEEHGSAAPYDKSSPRLIGHDWTTVVALRTPSPKTLRGSERGFDPATLLPLSGPLLSVRLIDRGDHGWLVYGLVPQSALVLAARELP